MTGTALRVVSAVGASLKTFGHPPKARFATGIRNIRP